MHEDFPQNVHGQKCQTLLNPSAGGTVRTLGVFEKGTCVKENVSVWGNKQVVKLLLTHCSCVDSREENMGKYTGC